MSGKSRSETGQDSLGIAGLQLELRLLGTSCRGGAGTHL